MLGFSRRAEVTVSKRLAEAAQRVGKLGPLRRSQRVGRSECTSNASPYWKKAIATRQSPLKAGALQVIPVSKSVLEGCTR